MNAKEEIVVHENSTLSFFHGGLLVDQNGHAGD
jgi:hypothetical protein